MVVLSKLMILKENLKKLSLMSLRKEEYRKSTSKVQEKVVQPTEFRIMVFHRGGGERDAYPAAES